MGKQGGYWADRLLQPRVEQYGHSNGLSDIDSMVDHLRACYPEYKRKQLRPFRMMVVDTVRSVRQKMRETEEQEDDGVDEEQQQQQDSQSRRSSRRVKSMETRLELKEKEHLRRRALVLDGSDSEESEKCDEGMQAVRKARGQESSEESEELDKARPAFNLLNSSLMSTYNSRPALVIQSPTFNGTSVFGNLQMEQKDAIATPSTSSAAVAPQAKSPKTLKASTSESARKRERDKEPEVKTPKLQSVKKSKKEVKDRGHDSFRANVSLNDFGGVGKIAESIGELILPVLFPGLFARLGTEPVRGLLLHGPPGCGKTMLAEAIANEADVPFLRISAPEIISGASGESEAKLRTLFSEAIRIAPSLIFIDEIDSISSKRESAQRETDRRLVTQMMTCMDELAQATSLPDDGDDANGDGKKAKCVLVVGATNRPDALDQALRRRFEREICLGIPDEATRLQILKVLTSKLRLEGDFDLKFLARRTPGYVGADLKALTKEAGLVAVKRIITTRSMDADGIPWWKSSWSPDEVQAVSITMQDFEEGIKKVQPSAKREGFTEIPNVTFEDVGSLDSVREELDLFICRRFKHPEDYEALGFTGSGFLLYGPPGCGKTLIAKAVANAAGVNFIYVKAGELFNKYVGESERAVRQLFYRARACAPCVIFFDEVDALVPSRGNEANAATDRVVNQLLVEMDNLERHGIFLLAATNRPNMIDNALLRPGRLGKHIYVPMPDAGGRASILKALLRRMPLAPDVDVSAISEHDMCKELTGADLHGLVQEACAVALRERVLLKEKSEKIALSQKHFMEALSKIKPSVSVKDYERDFTSAQQGEKSARKYLRTVASCSRG